MEGQFISKLGSGIGIDKIILNTDLIDISKIVFFSAKMDTTLLCPYLLSRANVMYRPLQLEVGLELAG